MKVIDLSRTIREDMKVYPGDPKVKIEQVHTHEENGWELRRLELGTHTGTHVDAFSHMHPDGESIDEIPLERFFGPAQVVTLGAAWPTGVGLFFTEAVDMDYLDKILAAKPGFVGGEITEELERALLGAGVITYTDLVNLDQLPLHTHFTFIGLPLKIKTGDGSPVRAMAMI